MKAAIVWIGCFLLTFLASCIIIGIKGTHEVALPSEFPPEAIVASLTFDGTVDDQSMYAVNGAPVSVRYRPGKVGRGLGLTGKTSSYVYFPDQEHYHIFEPTVEAWINLEGIGPCNTIVSENIQGADDDAKGFVLDVEGGRVRFAIGDDTRDWKVVTGITELSLHTWYHVVGVFHNGYLKVFVNGKLDGFSQVGPVNISYTPKIRTGPNPSVLYIGIRHSAHESPPTYARDLMYPFYGTIDEVQIYNRGLTESEVRALYRSRAGKN